MGEEWVFKCGRPHFLVQKLDFLKFRVCPHGQGGEGVSHCGHFADKRIDFSRFCADIFYGRPPPPYVYFWKLSSSVEDNGLSRKHNILGVSIKDVKVREERGLSIADKKFQMRTFKLIVAKT